MNLHHRAFNTRQIYLNSSFELQLLLIAPFSLHAAYSSLQLLQLEILYNKTETNSNLQKTHP